MSSETVFLGGGRMYTSSEVCKVLSEDRAEREAKHKQEIEELKSEYQNVIDANKEGHEEAVEQAREETRQQCAKAYKLYVKETLPSDWDDHDAEQAIRNSGKQDKGEGE